jgi:hypothetical protein
MIELVDHFEAAPNVHARVFDGELVILDLASGNYFGLNDVGAEFWEQMCAGRSVAEAAEVLQRRYATEREALIRDLRELAEELLERGLVRRRGT